MESQLPTEFSEDEDNVIQPFMFEPEASSSGDESEDNYSDNEKLKNTNWYIYCSLYMSFILFTIILKGADVAIAK